MDKNKLNSFNAQERLEELEVVVKEINNKTVKVKKENIAHNMHCHTIFSYNGYDFSPSYIASLAKKEGWFAAGIVDFDVLDGVNEFIDACQKLTVRYSCGLETRCFIPEFATREISSPGEPGIAYHMGVGFTSTDMSPKAQDFLNYLKSSAQNRTKDLVNKVNEFLLPVEVDFEKDALPLTPSGNVTERHICQAFENKAKITFPNNDKLISFWSEKLGLSADSAKDIVNNSVKLQGTIRSKTMKSGGVGYIKPTEETFPNIKDVNNFIIEAGGIPTIAWLNGLSDGEKAVNELLDLHIKLGGAVLNIVPDRNWNIADSTDKVIKLAELAKIIEQCKKRNLPIIVGTEMNAPGLKLVDSFDCEELKPYIQIFKEGAAIVYAHSLLAKKNKGYLSQWASEKFASIAEKNEYFTEYGINN